MARMEKTHPWSRKTIRSDDYVNLRLMMLQKCLFYLPY